MQENEFIPVHSAKSQKSKKKKRETVNKDSKNEKTWEDKIRDFDYTKINKALGVSLLLFSAFLFFAIVSYFLTWQVDQDKVINKGLFEFIFQTQ